MHSASKIDHMLLLLQHVFSFFCSCCCCCIYYILLLLLFIHSCVIIVIYCCIYDDDVVVIYMAQVTCKHSFMNPLWRKLWLLTTMKRVTHTYIHRLRKCNGLSYTLYAYIWSRIVHFHTEAVLIVACTQLFFYKPIKLLCTTKQNNAKKDIMIIRSNGKNMQNCGHPILKMN